MAGGGFRVSIPSSVKKMIENIREITGNHSEEEIYAMLKECSMDPNETAQKLLLQDPFHEVKRKRDRKKENANNRDSSESRWRNGTQGRGSRGGRMNFTPRFMSHDAGGGLNSQAAKENGTFEVIEKDVAPSLPTSQETKKEEKISIKSSLPIIGNGYSVVVSGSVSEITSTLIGNNNVARALSPLKKTETWDSQPTLGSSRCLELMPPASLSAVCLSSSDNGAVPTTDPWLPGALATIDSETGQLMSSEKTNTCYLESKLITGNIPTRAQDVEKNQQTEFSPSTSINCDLLVNQPSSDYGNQPQQTIGSHKVGSNMEWKPKPTNSTLVNSSGQVGMGDISEDPPVSFEVADQSQHASNVLDSEELTLKLQKKMEGLQLLPSQLVTLPDNIHIPESEKHKLCFGSFNFDFGASTCYINSSENDIDSTTVSETSQGMEDSADKQNLSNENSLANEEGDYPDRLQSPTHAPENLSSCEDGVPTSVIQEYNDLKHGTELPSGGHQSSVVHNSPTYSCVPSIIGNEFAPFESNESQARDFTRLQSFVVPQPFDPTSYYAQFYRSGADSDGSRSPYPPVVSTKYNGNVVALATPSSQSPQEGEVLSTAGPSTLVTQAAGLMQSSIAVTQHPVAVFRPPAGVHIAHYPPNYLPYGPYFPPFYLPPTAMHQYLGNNAFHPQPQSGSIYPSPPAAAASGVKYSIPQYKQGANSGNSTHSGMLNGYGSYGSFPSGYNPSSAATAGNPTNNEDHGASQFKDNDIYITRPQSEGSAVWVATPGHNMSSLPTSSFYNLPPQGQHLPFTPTQTGHGTFSSMYQPVQAVNAASVHPLLQQSQAIAGGVDIVGPGGSSVYQQPQHSQINWPSTY